MEKINRYKAHPWHGVSPGNIVPQEVTAYIEVVPRDTVKYEIDKVSGILMIDRPQKFSNIVPALYGFVPQTYCGRFIAEYAAQQTGKTVEMGDGDPLDICVLCEAEISNGDFLLNAIPIGGIRMIDKGEADDKIIAVLKSDEVYAAWHDLKDVPESLINRLKHYFLTYKNIPGTDAPIVSIASIYGRDEAYEVIRRSLLDYKEKFGDH